MARHEANNYAPKQHSLDNNNGDIEMGVVCEENDRGLEQEHSTAVTVVVPDNRPAGEQVALVHYQAFFGQVDVISETILKTASADSFEISCDTGEMSTQEHSIYLEHKDSGLPDWMHSDLPVAETQEKPKKFGPERPPKNNKPDNGKELVKIAKLLNSRTRAEKVHEIRHHAGRLQLSPQDYNDLGFSSLHQVAWGDEDQSKLLQQPNPPGLNALAIGGLTPLHVAAFRGQTKVVEILLSKEGIHLDAKTTSVEVKNGVDMNLWTSETDDLSTNCTGIQRTGKASSLMEDGKPLEHWEGLTALHLAADGDHLGVVKLLLEAARERSDDYLRAFVNAKDGVLGRTALHFACRHGKKAVVIEFLQCKVGKDEHEVAVVDLKATDSYWGNAFDGYTPFLLTAAAEGDRFRVMELFFNEEILPDFKGHDMSVQVDDILRSSELQKMQENMDWRVILTFPKLVDSHYTDVYQPQCFSSELIRAREPAREPEEFQTMQSKRFSAMRLAIRGNNAKVLRCLIKNLLSKPKIPAKIWRSQSFYSAGKMSQESLLKEFLHYAARIGSQKAVQVLLYVNLATAGATVTPEEASKKYAARANSMLHGSNAVQVVVQRLFAYAQMKVNKEDEDYNMNLWRQTTEVVNIIAKVEGFHTFKRDSQDRTIFYYFCECATAMPPMEEKRKKQRTMLIKNITQRFVTENEDIRNTCTLYENEKLKLQNACNALLVGATLIAGLAFNGLLQPPKSSTPGRINYYVNSFWTFNSLAFYFTIYTIICCLKVIIPQRKLFIPGLSEYVEDEIENLRVRVTFASFWFTLSATLAIGAYITGEFLMAPSKKLVLASTIFGLVYLVPLIITFLGHDYARLAKDLFDEYHWFHILLQKPFFIVSFIQWIRDSLLGMFRFKPTKKSSSSLEDTIDVNQKGQSSDTARFPMRQWTKYKQQRIIISNVIVSHLVVIGAVFVFWISLFSNPSSTS